MTGKEIRWTEIAKQLGATKVEEGCNWIWALGFTSREKAEQFDKTPGMDTRGVYDDDNGKFKVRFREF